MTASKGKRVVLIFMDWYLPGYKAGGPVRTCVNMVERLRNDFDFRIVTRDTDLNETSPYQDITSDSWVTGPDGSAVYYFSKKNLSIKNIRKLILEVRPDVIHLNSMFSFFFTMAPLLALRKKNPGFRVVLGPRGMLSKGALAIKPLKKYLFLQLSSHLGLFKNVIWHASTPVEREEIYAAFGKQVHVLLAIDLAPEVNIQSHNREKYSGTVNLFFLGRVAEVKNLLQNIRVLQQLEHCKSLCFDIYGPIEEPGYWETCKQEIAKLPESIRVTHKGALDNDQLPNTLKNYHFLYLLTLNENYGHAIVESFIEGCPVIISNRTPWRNLEVVKAGWDMELNDNDKIAGVVSHACSMDQQEYNSWSAAASNMADRIVNNPQSLTDNKNLFADWPVTTKPNHQSS